MSPARTVKVAEDEAEIRLDRWFRRHFPDLTHGRLEKLLRTGQIRIDGGRAKAGDRLAPGQQVRVPPLSDAPARPRPDRPPVPAVEAEALRRRVLHRDDAVLVIDKPPGLAVQGGSKVDRHLDAMLDALRFDATERPKLVHRLDRDTSGVLLLARTARAAAKLAAGFRDKSTAKLYWALVAGVPKVAQGRIDLALVKAAMRGGERMVALAEEAGEDEAEAKRAVTLYRVVDIASRRAAWLELMPVTGRTHQLRAHCAAIGTPIVGDGKYGGDRALLTGSVSRKLHLHARALRLPHPDGGLLQVTAPLPEHMRETWRLLGFEAPAGDPFAAFDR